MRRRSPEADMQIALVGLLDGMTDRFPELRLLFAVNPNPGGNNSKAARGKAKAMGLRRGVPDLLLPVPRDLYTGYAVELKAPGKKPTSEQDHWHGMLEVAGWMVDWFDDSGSAIQGFLKYLALPRQTIPESPMISLLSTDVFQWNP